MVPGSGRLDLWCFCCWMLVLVLVLVVAGVGEWCAVESAARLMLGWASAVRWAFWDTGVVRLPGRRTLRVSMRLSPCWVVVVEMFGGVLGWKIGWMKRSFYVSAAPSAKLAPIGMLRVTSAGVYYSTGTSHSRNIVTMTAMGRAGHV